VLSWMTHKLKERAELAAALANVVARSPAALQGQPPRQACRRKSSGTMRGDTAAPSG